MVGSEQKLGKGKRKFVFLMGPSHSGTTLLTLLLSRYSEIVTIGELKATSRGNLDQYRCSCGDLILSCPFWLSVADEAKKKGLKFSLEDFGTHFSQGGPITRRLLYASLRGPVFEMVRDLLIDLLPLTRRYRDRVIRTNQELVEIISGKLGGEMFLDGSKDPIRLKYLSRIDSWDISVIEMVRDGRATCYSYMNNYEYTMEKAAREWRQTCLEFEHITQIIPAQKIISTRYEDLCGNPEGEIGRILGFLNISSAQSDTPEKETHILGNSMRLSGDMKIVHDAKWKRGLDSAKLHIFNRVAGDINEHYGYK